MTLQDCIAKHGLAPGSMIYGVGESDVYFIDIDGASICSKYEPRIIAAVASCEWIAEAKRHKILMEQLEAGLNARDYQKVFESLKGASRGTIE